MLLKKMMNNYKFEMSAASIQKEQYFLGIRIYRKRIATYKLEKIEWSGHDSIHFIFEGDEKISLQGLNDATRSQLEGNYEKIQRKYLDQPK